MYTVGHTGGPIATAGTNHFVKHTHEGQWHCHRMLATGHADSMFEHKSEVHYPCDEIRQGALWILLEKSKESNRQRMSNLNCSCAVLLKPTTDIKILLHKLEKYRQRMSNLNWLCAALAKTAHRPRCSQTKSVNGWLYHQCHQVSQEQ